MTVNKRQMAVMWVALASGIMMGAFPPWIYTTDYSWGGQSEKSERSAGYAFLGKPPQPVEGCFTSRLTEPHRKLGAGVRIDAARLGIQYIMLTIIFGGLLFMLKGGPSAGPSHASRTYTDEELTAALRRAKATSKREAPDTAGDDSDEDDDPPSHSSAPAIAVNCADARTTAGAVKTHSRWRLRPLASVGFEFDPCLWLFSLVGSLLLIFMDGLGRVALDDANGIAWTLEGVVKNTLPCFIFALVNSYIAWRLAPKSPNAPFWGGLCGIALAVAMMIFGDIHSDKDCQQRNSAARSNAQYLAR